MGHLQNQWALLCSLVFADLSFWWGPPIKVLDKKIMTWTPMTST